MQRYANRLFRATLLAGASTALLPSAALLLSASGAIAEDAPSARPAIERITVTAEKRKVDLQKEPLAVSVLSSRILDQSNVVDPSDLSGRVPGLTIAKNAGAERIVTIRGVGWETSANVSSQAGTSFHVDGVFIGSPYALHENFFDVDQIEVLRGPQGTVFGQNSVGGVINVIEKQPELAKFSANGDFSVGTYALVQTRAAVNVPVGGHLAIRATLQQFRHDGFAVANGGNLHSYALDEANDYSGKLAVLWEPSDNFSLTLASQIYDSHTHGGAEKNIYDPRPDPRNLSQDYPSTSGIDSSVSYAVAKWTLPWATAKVISSYQYMVHNQSLDNDRLDFAHSNPHDIVAGWNNHERTFTEEINLASNPGGIIDWIAGGFYLDDKNKQMIAECYAFIQDQPCNIPKQASSIGQLYTLVPDFAYTLYVIPYRKTYSPYGQLTWHATDALRLTAGARFSHDLSYSWVNTDYDLFTPAGKLETRNNKLTGKIGIEYDVSPQSLLYASWSRGYKGGGANNNQHPVVVPLIYKPEIVESYEVGAKNRLLGEKLRLNIAAFYYNYDNFQYLEGDPIPFQGGVSSIPKAHVWGGEAESSYLLPDDFRLDGTLSAMGGEIVGDTLALDPALASKITGQFATKGYSAYDSRVIGALLAARQNLKGNTPPKLSPFSLSLALQHFDDFADGGMVTERVDYTYHAPFFYRVFNDPGIDSVPACGLWNMFFQYQPPTGNITYSLIGSNLFDRACVNSKMTNPYGIGTTSEEFVPPLQVIFRVGFTL